MIKYKTKIRTKLIDILSQPWSWVLFVCVYIGCSYFLWWLCDYKHGRYIIQKHYVESQNNNRCGIYTPKRTALQRCLALHTEESISCELDARGIFVESCKILWHEQDSDEPTTTCLLTPYIVRGGSIRVRVCLCISIEFLGSLLTMRWGQDYLFVVGDRFSNMVVLMHCKKIITREEIVRLFFQHVWTHFDLLSSIIHDMYFLSSFWNSL